MKAQEAADRLLMLVYLSSVMEGDVRAPALGDTGGMDVVAFQCRYFMKGNPMSRFCGGARSPPPRPRSSLGRQHSRKHTGEHPQPHN